MPGGDRSARAEWVHSPAGRLGSKVHLEAVPVKSMEARLANGPGIVPRQTLSQVAVLTDADGRVVQTEGAGPGESPVERSEGYGKCGNRQQEGRRVTSAR